MHLFSGEVDESSLAASSLPETDSGLEARVQLLEQQVATLQQQLSDLLAEGERT